MNEKALGFKMTSSKLAAMGAAGRRARTERAEHKPLFGSGQPEKWSLCRNEPEANIGAAENAFPPFVLSFQFYRSTSVSDFPVLLFFDRTLILYWIADIRQAELVCGNQRIGLSWL